MQQIVTPVETGTEKKISIEKPRENNKMCILQGTRSRQGRV